MSKEVYLSVSGMGDLGSFSADMSRAVWWVGTTDFQLGKHKG